MAGFSVNTAGLQGMSAQLLRAGTDAEAVRAHLAKCDTSAFSGFLETVRGRFEDVLHSQINNATDAQFGTQQVGNEIANSLDYYRTTDEAQAASFDAKLPTSAEANFMFTDRPATLRPSPTPMSTSRRAG